VAARIFSTIKADGRRNAVHVDDMQHRVAMTEPGFERATDDRYVSSSTGGAVCDIRQHFRRPS